jgi:MFS family permease
MIHVPATIINSDVIPFRKRGMYQAMQNGVFGFGAICGASFGGSIADHIGWRWCFLLQVPVSALALVLGALVLRDQAGGFDVRPGFRVLWAKIDVLGALLLVTAISLQLIGLSLGGNELAWGHPWVIGSLVGSVVLFALFIHVEGSTAAIPIIPLRLLRGGLSVLIQIANNFVGLASYAVSFSSLQCPGVRPPR